LIPLEYKLAQRAARALRTAGEPLPAREVIYRILSLSSIADSHQRMLEKMAEPVIDGRFFRDEDRLGLWEWRYPMAAEGQPLVVLDLETTGLSPRDNEIIEIALLRIDGGELTRFSTMVNPGGPIPPFITRLTGINDADVAAAPDVYQALEEALPYLQGATLIIQNAPFDMGFLRPRARRLGVKMHNEVVDTVQWARRALPMLKRKGLDQLIRVFDVPIKAKERHRAFGDVEATWAVAKELYYILTAGVQIRPSEV